MTSALTLHPPQYCYGGRVALSPRRGRIDRRSSENVYGWIGWTLIRKTRHNRKPFPLLSAFAFGFGAIASKRSEDGGERIKGEGGRKHSLHWIRRGSINSNAKDEARLKSLETKKPGQFSGPARETNLDSFFALSGAIFCLRLKSL